MNLYIYFEPTIAPFSMKCSYIFCHSILFYSFGVYYS
uniref:Uncharacterized protein n=1 Tax=Wildemania schizophylla TaxID=1134705 RepID=A0A126G230_WILSC|nr:hypothetical protein [Wildemania schizophylla]AKS28464.1 hypothetical protein [Wildemania schizophylla]